MLSAPAPYPPMNGPAATPTLPAGSGIVRSMQTFFNKLAQRFGTTASPGGVLLWLLRGAFGAIVIGVAYVAFSYYNNPPHYETGAGLAAFFGVILSGLIVVAMDMSIRSKEITTISAIYFGLLLGFLLGTLF